jgi:molybdate transport system regulatory protein
MPKKRTTRSGETQNPESSDSARLHPDSGLMNPARIYAVPQETRYLDPTDLAKLEQSFRLWERASSRADVRISRKRILLIFLLIRYTGARLNEVLALDLRKDIDASKRIVRYRNSGGVNSSAAREVQISSELMSEIQKTLDDHALAEEAALLLKVDAGHVRRKFYERAVACGFAQDLGSPNAIRRARAVELMQSNVPLPVVQRVLGHSTPSLTASFISFSEEDIDQVARHFIETESRRKTSARNAFFGKIRAIRLGDIQSEVELVTVGGEVITTVITNNSLKRLGLKVSSLVTAEVKAPWVVLQKSEMQPLCTAENVFYGSVSQILRGKLTTELIVRVQDGTEFCSLVTEESRRKLDVKKNDKVWVMFNSFAVILHVH